MKIARACVACDGDRIDRVPAVLMPFVAYRVFGWEPIDIDPAWGFRDIGAGTARSVCNSLLCRTCGMLFLDMRFDDEEMGALYNDYRGPAYSEARARFEPGYAERNAILLGGSGYIATVENFIAPHLSGRPRVLDWGGDTGINTPFRGSAQIHHVHDISSRPVIEGAVAVSLEEAAANAYDLVVFSNVLEHVPSPRSSLAAITAVMKPETVLYVELPHEDVIRLVEGADDRLRRKRHWHEHINFFTPEALDALLRNVGLQTVARISHPILGRRQGEPRLLDHRAARRLSQVVRRRRAPAPSARQSKADGRRCRSPRRACRTAARGSAGPKGRAEHA